MRSEGDWQIYCHLYDHLIVIRVYVNLIKYRGERLRRRKSLREKRVEETKKWVCPLVDISTGVLFVCPMFVCASVNLCLCFYSGCLLDYTHGMANFIRISSI